MVAPNEDQDSYHILPDGVYEAFGNANIVHEQTSSRDNSTFFHPNASNPSMGTMQRGAVANYFRSICGFTFPADNNVPLVFPTDKIADQTDRLLHVILHLCRGGQNVPSGVDEMLRRGGVDEYGMGARVLDMVTNSGTWVSEMAESYPAAVFTSVDTKPLVPHKPNQKINFQIYDYYNGIMEPDACFDLVHMRQGVLATKNFNFLLQEIHRVLKPGGYLMVTEIPFDVYEGNDPVPLHSAPHLARGIKLVYEVSEIEGVDTNAWRDMSARLDPSHPLWNNPSIDVTRMVGAPEDGTTNLRPVRGFREIDFQAMPIPLGTWHSNEHQRLLGGLLRLWGYYQSQSVLPAALLSAEGNEASSFVQAVQQEIKEIDRYRSYMISLTWLARRI